MEPRLLLVAHHCNPEWGSEPLIGWRWVSHLAATHRVHLVTHIRNRAAIEARDLDADVSYVDTERVAGRVDRLNQRVWGDRAPVNKLALEVLAQRAFDRAACAIARALIEDGAIDVIHRVSPISPRFPTRLGRLGVPLVIGPVNGGMSTAPGFDEVSRRERERLLAFRGLARLLDPLGRTYADADFVLIANEQTRSTLPGLARNKAFVVAENAVRLEDYHPQFRRRGGPLRLLYLGRLLAYKGVQYVVEAAARARSRGVELTVDVIGDGPMRGELEALAEQRGLKDVARFHGAIPVDDVPRAFQACDLYVFPSVRESGGSTVIEAMAAGKPVIVVDHGGPSETVDEHSGIKLAPQGPAVLVDELADSIVALAGDEPRREAMGRAARERVEGMFTWDGRARLAARLYSMAPMRNWRTGGSAAGSLKAVEVQP